MLKRPFRILGLQQVAIGSTDKSELRHFWCELLGLETHSSYRNEKENVDEDILCLGGGTHANVYGIEIDLMQPIDPQRSPKVHLPPLNHIGLWVDNLKAAVSYLEGKGVRFTPGGIRKGAAGHEVCFIHPKGNDVFPIGGQGILIELVQAPAEIIESLS